MAVTEASVDAVTGTPVDYLTVIEPPRRFPTIDFKEIWRSRELLWSFLVRDIKVRYRQTALGAIWAVLQPLLTMTVLCFVFGRLEALRDSSGGIGYASYVLSGLLVWIYFGGTLSAAANSVFGNAHLVSKTYFPRLIIPLSALGPNLTDLGIATALMIVVAPFLAGTWPGLHLLLLPVAVGLVSVLVFGLGSLCAGLCVLYRDVRYVIPFILQIGFYVSPIMYSPTLFGEKWRFAFELNPITGLLGLFRYSIFGKPELLYGYSLLWAVCFTFASVVVGVYFFRQCERYFADLV